MILTLHAWCWYRGITASGKSESSKLLVAQILRLSARSKRENKLAEQVKALSTILDSFGNAKTLLNPNASRHGRYVELHFNDRGRISAAKALTYGLDKSRLNRLSTEERTFHVFYQLLAGCTSDERDRLNLEDMSDYALLASSGCYRLPGGPFSDDATAMTELRAAMRTLGFKAKHVPSIFNTLVVILLLGNLEFVEGVSREDTAHVSNTLVLDHIARLLGVSSEDLEQALTIKTSYVRKELYTVLLNPEQSAHQRDQLIRDLYAILFAFVVETSNHKLAPSSSDAPPLTQIVLLDHPGYQSRGPSGTNSIALTSHAPLISAYGQNGFDTFCINLADELVHSYVVRNTFEDSVGYNASITSDGVSLPSIQTMDNSACVELLRGVSLGDRAHRKPGGVLGVMNKASSNYKQGKGGEKRDEDMLQDMMTKFGVHSSFVSSPSVGGAADRNLFGINHYAGPCSYDVSGFIEKDTDLLDAGFVSLLRGSGDSFISKLVSGPSLATEAHSQDASIVVQAQVSSRPLRHPTPIQGATPSNDEPNALDSSKTYPITTQLNHTLSELFSTLEKTHLWMVSCIRPNDSGSPNSFDKRRVKAQIRALLLPDLIARKKTAFDVDFGQEEFCERYVPTMLGETHLRIRQCAQKNGLQEGSDYVLGHRNIWLTYAAWKLVEDGIREQEALGSTVDAEELDDAATEHTRDESNAFGVHGQSEYFDESVDNLLLTRTGSRGTNYLEPNPGAANAYAAGGLRSPGVDAAPQYSEPDDGSAWGSEWEKKRDIDAGAPGQTLPKEAGGIVVNNAPNTVEEVPTSRSRRWWLFLVTACTWWIPDFLLKHVGRMKRPDVRLAWREKLTICMLIFFACAFIIFYIIFFGNLLCPGKNKAWTVQDVSEHSASNDYFVAIRGSVYDVGSFVTHDHSDVSNVQSNSQATLEELGGVDMTNYFVPPLVLACAGLVSDDTLQLRFKNFTAIDSSAVHTSGALTSYTTSALASPDWYTSTFLPKIKQYRKGALVYKADDVATQAADETEQKYVVIVTFCIHMSDNFARIWAFYEDSLFDLTDYDNTKSIFSSDNDYSFLDTNVYNAFKQGAGGDITNELKSVFASMDSGTANNNLNCLKNAFYLGERDFRDSPKCQVQNVLLLVFSIILVVTIAAKCKSLFPKLFMYVADNN